MGETRREQLAKKVASRYEQGQYLREIARDLGLSTSYVGELLRDADGSKVRARKFRGKCEDCGAVIRNDEPGRRPQRWCGACQKTQLHEAARERARARLAEVEAMWNRGWSIREIAAAMDWKVETTGQYIVRERKDGADLPYRYRHLEVDAL